MKNLAIKIRHILLPYLLVSLGTIAGYSALRWIVDIHFHWIPLKDEVYNIWLPLLFCWFPVVLVLRRRIKIIKGRPRNGHFFYLLLAAGTTLLGTTTAQHYIAKSAFDLIPVTEVSDVKAHINEKFFTIDSFSVNAYGRLPYTTSRITGRNNESLNYALFLSCPFETDSSEFWYGLKFRKRINNRSTKQFKQEAYDTFIKHAMDSFERYDFHRVTYFEKVNISDDLDGFLNAIATFRPELPITEQVVLIPQSEAFEERATESYHWFIGIYEMGSLLFLILLIFAPIDPDGLAFYKEGKPVEDDDLSAMMAYLNPVGEHREIAILVWVNLLVFLAMMLAGINLFSPSFNDLLDIGGNRRQEFLNGEYWRLITSMFIHGGLMHIASNLFGLVLAGIMLKDIVDWRRLLLIYLFCGVVAGLASVYWHDNTLSVGASGAIFGWYGLIIAFSLTKVFPRDELRWTWAFSAFYVGSSILMGIFGGIDNAAHVGGLLCGLLIGLLLSISIKEKQHLRENI